jgi:hypothetical protein
MLKFIDQGIEIAILIRFGAGTQKNEKNLIC